MKKWYGSLQNRLMELGDFPITPEVGMGATELCYSDRHAYEVVKVADDRHITVRRMKAKCLDYFAGDWEVTPNPDGIEHELFRTKKGQWRERYGKRKLGCNVFLIGYATEYEDPSF